VCTGWRYWQQILGFPIVFAISLYLLYSHMTEATLRDRTVAEGREANGFVHGPTGNEYVTVDWTDADGHPRTAIAWTGKPFARVIRERPPHGRQVAIKYLDDARIAPVILDQVAEREHDNQWWLNAATGLGLVSGGWCAVMLAVELWDRWSRAARPRDERAD
jgi:hypothetical protein